MKVIELMVELHGNKEVSINGRQSACGLSLFDEKLYSSFEPIQQWHVLCELKKLMARAHYTYMKGRVLRGEITEGDAKRLLSQSSANYKQLSAADRALYDKISKLGE